MKPRNPFYVTGYGGPKYFCDRVTELAKLRAAIENGRNVTLLAARRMGKTGLIHHLFNALADSDVPTIYVDIFATQNLVEFTKRFASAVIGSLDTDFNRALKAATRFFKSFRPGVTIDPVTGAQSYSFGLQPSQTEATLKECFDYLAQRGPCVVAIDEFQQIGEYPETGTEALLRSYVQFLPDVRFIFAGSRHHLMTEMFSSTKRPFYNSTQTLPLGCLGRTVYREFACRLMKEGGITLEAPVFDRVADLFDGITWYVQTVMNRLFERRRATEADVGEVVEELMEEKCWEYAALLKSLPRRSARVLKAVAQAGKVAAPLGADFLVQYAPGSPSTVHQAFGKLLEDELLYEEDDGIVVYDRLFGYWLRRA